MTFTKVDYPVERGKTNERTSRKNVDPIFDEFMSMNKIGHYVIMSVYFIPVVYSQKEKSV